MTGLEERVIGIDESVTAEFNALPFEEKKRINKYISHIKILTLWQVLNANRDITTQKWRSKMQKWLENCVEFHLKKNGIDM